MINNKKIVSYLFCLILMISFTTFSVSAQITTHEGEEPTIHDEEDYTENSSQSTDNYNSSSEDSYNSYEDNQTQDNNQAQTTEEDYNTNDTQESDEAVESDYTDNSEVQTDATVDEQAQEGESSAVEIIETVSANKERGSVNETINLLGYSCIGLGAIGIISVIWWSIAGRNKKKTPEAVAYEEVERAEMRNRAEASKKPAKPASKTAYNDSFNYDNISPNPARRAPQKTQRAQQPSSTTRQQRSSAAQTQRKAPTAPQKRAPQNTQKPVNKTVNRNSKYDTDEILKEILGKKSK